MAAKLQNFELVTEICDWEGVEKDKHNSLGKTALHYVASSNNIDVASKLLHHNAKALLEKDKEGGYTPVHIACKHGREEMLYLMINSYKTELQKPIEELMTIVTHDRKTPLLVAKCALPYPSHNIITLLIEIGSEVSAVDKYKNSMLHLYSAKDDANINEYILEKDSSLLKCKNCNLETPLHIAASYGHSETCHLYIKK